MPQDSPNNVDPNADDGLTDCGRCNGCRDLFDTCGGCLVAVGLVFFSLIGLLITS
ncbi:MAG: hypothetical protein Q7S64_01230 [bacterium]|nr:hypothetical protein [bacterium]